MIDQSQPKTALEIADHDLETTHGELVCFRQIIDELAQHDGRDYLGGLSFWLQHIIDDFEDAKIDLQMKLREVRP